MILTTCDFIPNKKIKEILGIVLVIQLEQKILQKILLQH